MRHLALAGGRAVPVRALTWVAAPAARADALEGPAGKALVRGPEFAEVRLQVPAGPFGRFVGPWPGDGETDVVNDYGSISFAGGARVRVRIPVDPGRGRAAHAWIAGRLERLF